MNKKSKTTKTPLSKKKKRLTSISILLVLLLLLVFVLINNKKIEISTVEYYNDSIPASFDNYSVVQISDLHNEEFGDNQKILIEKVKLLNPDLIVFTGDMVDRNKYDLETTMTFIKGIKDVAPIYSISGNHESSIDYNELYNRFTEEGVIILEDDMELITVNNETIELIGLSDPSFLPNEPYLGDLGIENIEDVLSKYKESDNFQLLLSHRPELFNIYVENSMELVLCGHAHGGQVRLPFIGGLVAPDQGLFPKYDAGLFVENGTSMYVSRGLGNSIVPLRINNNPEIVNIILNPSK